LAICGLLLFVGCGAKEAGLFGEVTFENTAIEKGFITFFPVDDPAGATKGAEIVDGKYKISGLTPGKKRVRIAAEPRTQIVPRKGGATPQVKFMPPKTPVPGNAIGNDQVVVIAPGERHCDFHL